MPFELFVALRYLVARRRQAFISLISFVSALGVAGRRRGADHRARADDRPAGRAARSHARLDARTSSSTSPPKSGIADPAAAMRASCARCPASSAPRRWCSGKALVRTGAGRGVRHPQGRSIRRSRRRSPSIGRQMTAGQPRRAGVARGDGPDGIAIGAELAASARQVQVGDSLIAADARGHADADGRDAAHAHAQGRRHLLARALRVRLRLRGRLAADVGAAADRPRRTPTSSSCASTTSIGRRRSPPTSCSGSARPTSRRTGPT